MPFVQQNFLNLAELKFDPLSVMMSCGTPNRCIMPCIKLTAVAESRALIGFASIHFVNLSTATKMWVKPCLPVWSGLIISSPQTANGQATGIVFSSEDGLRGWLA